jgi:hypothetical protein
MPWRGGCPLGPALARREVTLTPGRYTLVVRGDPYFDDRGGVYVVKLTCADGAATRAATSSDPGGLSVDSVTGAITGTPQQEGDNFHMQLRAVDGARGAAVVAEWHFNVRDPIFSTAESWAGTPDASRGIVPRYHVGQFHTLRAPPLNKHQLFVLPANNNFDNIGEWDTLDSSLCVCVCVCARARARVCVCVCVNQRLRLLSPSQTLLSNMHKSVCLAHMTCRSLQLCGYSITAALISCSVPSPRQWNKRMLAKRRVYQRGHRSGCVQLELYRKLHCRAQSTRYCRRRGGCQPVEL